MRSEADGCLYETYVPDSKCFASHTVGLNDILTLFYVNLIRHNFTVRVMPKDDSFCQGFSLVARRMSGDSLTFGAAVRHVADNAAQAADAAARLRAEHRRRRQRGRAGKPSLPANPPPLLNVPAPRQRGLSAVEPSGPAVAGPPGYFAASAVAGARSPAEAVVTPLIEAPRYLKSAPNRSATMRELASLPRTCGNEDASRWAQRP